MTQVTPVSQPPSSSSVFARTPVNPHSQKVQEAMQQPAPVAPPPPSVTPQLPPQNIAPQSIPTQTMVHPAAPPAVAPPVTPPQPQYDPRMLLAVQQMQAEQQRLAEENAEAQKTISNLLSKSDELEALKQRQLLQDSLAKDAFADLETVDPGDAQRITNAVLNATAPAMTAMQQELAKTRQQLAESQQQMQQRLAQTQVQNVNQRILQAHPDFFQLQHTPEYHAFMNQRDGLSFQTRDQRAAQEFSQGNADYVIDLLNQLKKTTPSTDSISTVAPVQSAAAISPVAASESAPPMTLKELNSLYQLGQVTPDDYRNMVKAVRASYYNS